MYLFENRSMCFLKALIIVIFIYGAFTHAQANISLKFKETQGRKSIVLNTESNIENEEWNPALSYDKEEGDFRLELKGIKGEQYQGEQIRKLAGDIPLRVIVDITEDNTLALRGRTQAFSDIKSKPANGQGYKLDIYYKTASFTENLNSNTSEEKKSSPQKNKLFAQTDQKESGQSTEGIKEGKLNQEKGKISKLFPYLKKFLTGVIIVLFLAGGTWLVLKIYGNNVFFKTQEKKGNYQERQNRNSREGVKSEIETSKQKTSSRINTNTVDREEANTEINYPVEEEVEPEDNYTKSTNKDNSQKEKNVQIQDESSSRVEHLMEMKNISYQEASLILKMKGNYSNGKEK